MKSTTYFSKITHIDYEFDAYDVQLALIAYYKIHISESTKVTVEMYEGNSEYGTKDRVCMSVKLDQPLEGPNESNGASGGTGTE